MARSNDLTGQVFGKLIVVKREENIKGRASWLCRCECGNEKNILAQSLLNGNTKSCGCITKERLTRHGMFGTRLYRIYRGIKDRCERSNHVEYHNYGGRGIKICEEWLNKEKGFMDFYNWAIDNGYQEDLTIDRIDVNGNYEPSNCRWVTLETQNNNRRDNNLIALGEEVKTISQWAKQYDINYYTFYNWYRRGWSSEKIMNHIIKIKGGVAHEGV